MAEDVQFGTQNHWLAPRSTQPFILPRLINWMPGTPGNWRVKSKHSPRSGSAALRQLNPIHKKGPQSFFLIDNGDDEIVAEISKIHNNESCYKDSALTFAISRLCVTVRMAELKLLKLFYVCHTFYKWQYIYSKVQTHKSYIALCMFLCNAASLSLVS